LSIKKFALILGAGLGYCGLIFLEPNLSITLVLGAATFAILFLCGAKLKHLLLVTAPALVALPVMLVAEPYRIRRLLAFIDPWARPKDEGFQLIQSLFGLGNGGFFGVGFGNSTQKHMFLPFAESDFIFSIIGEEFGFVGSVIFIAVLAAIIVQIFRTGARCEDRFGKYLCFGIGTVLFIQSAVNLAVVTGCIPPTGVPLPFISFGGTSLAVCMGAIGVVLNVEKHNRKKS
jgi:cell division protein FtsW